MRKKTTKSLRARRTPKVTRKDSPTASKSEPVRKTQSARQPKPRTAYELLQRVCHHILEEPKRYNQETYFETGKRDIQMTWGFAPACGTMACRAGWIVALHDGTKHTSPLSAQDRANEILGMSSGATDHLFKGSALHIAARRNTTDIIGTPAYARLGVKGLRIFMKRYTARLKERLLSDVRRLDARSGY